MSSALTGSPPWPTTEWDHIADGLYQGGHVYTFGGFDFAVGHLAGVRLFDLVVSLYTTPWDKTTTPDPDIPHLVFEIRDDPGGVRPEDEQDLHAAVTLVCETLDAGRKVLVRCQAGYNRSGLVCALVLVRRGMAPQDAVALLREKRSPWVLCNRAFEKYVLDSTTGILGMTDPADYLYIPDNRHMSSGWTSHGHPYGPTPDRTQQPRAVARCGGPGLCKTCAQECEAAQPPPPAGTCRHWFDHGHCICCAATRPGAHGPAHDPYPAGGYPGQPQRPGTIGA